MITAITPYFQALAARRVRNEVDRSESACGAAVFYTEASSNGRTRVFDTLDGSSTLPASAIH